MARRMPFTLLLVGLWVAVALLAPLRPLTQRPDSDTSAYGAPGRAGLRRLLQTATETTTGEKPSAEATPTALGEGAGKGEAGTTSSDQGAAPRNCTPPALGDFPEDLMPTATRRRGGAIVHALVAAYLFLFLAVICDDYFVPSIKILCANLKLPEDVAGATFMAAATSSPELFVNCVGTFITEGDIGVGTVVGSGVFNILVVPACCGLFGGKEVRLHAWPLTRDCLAYAATVLLLIGALSDGRVEWFEAATFVALYVVYVVALCCGPRICACLRRGCLGERAAHDAPDGQPADAHRHCESSPLLPRVSDEKVRGWHYQFSSGNSNLVVHDIEECEEESACSPPQGAGFCAFLGWLLLRPIKAALCLSVPDCRRHRRRMLYPLTFLMCIVWIAAASYVVAWMLTVVGDTLQIPDSVMGLTLLAAGTSLPEVVSSVIVTNQGYGAMGIGNSIGSNTFNILLCLGLPWLLKSVFFLPAPGQYWVNINSGGLLYNTVSLMTTLLLLYTAFAYNSFKLDRKVGAITLIMYLCFVAIAFAVELNVFTVVNLPTCPH